MKQKNLLNYQKSKKEKEALRKKINHMKNSQEGRGQRLQRWWMKSYKNHIKKVDELECVPNISKYVETKESVKLAYAQLQKTYLEEVEKPNINSSGPCISL